MNGWIHNQKIVLEDISVQFDKPQDIVAHLGRFDKIQRKVTLIKGPINCYDETVIHEFTHAASGFGFVFDPLPVKHRLSIFGSEESQQNIFNQSALEFGEAPVLPHPAYESPRKRTTFTNVAALKFKQCVHLDMQNYQDNTENSFEFNLNNRSIDNEVAIFMSTMSRHIKEHGYTNETLQEVLPYYMGCRARMLIIAKENNIPSKEIYNKLAEKIPHIHAYCETDFKKVLHYRLKYYHTRYNDGYYSEYLERHANVTLTSLTTTFCESGTLEFHRSKYTSKRSAEFSASLFSHKAKAQKSLESAQIFTDEESNKKLYV